MGATGTRSITPKVISVSKCRNLGRRGKNNNTPGPFAPGPMCRTALHPRFWVAPMPADPPHLRPCPHAPTPSPDGRRSVRIRTAAHTSTPFTPSHSAAGWSSAKCMQHCQIYVSDPRSVCPIVTLHAACASSLTGIKPCKASTWIPNGARKVRPRSFAPTPYLHAQLLTCTGSTTLWGAGARRDRQLPADPCVSWEIRVIHAPLRSLH